MSSTNHDVSNHDVSDWLRGGSAQSLVVGLRRPRARAGAKSAREHRTENQPMQDASRVERFFENVDLDRLQHARRGRGNATQKVRRRDSIMALVSEKILRFIRFDLDSCFIF